MKSFAFVVAVAVLGAASQPALADKRKDADALFKQGKKLHGDKKFSSACLLFERSDALDPAIGTKLNAAKCYEDWGKLASAFRWYSAAEKMAAKTSDKRVDQIRELIANLDPDVPKLTIKVPDKVDLEAAEIHLDGKPLEPAELGAMRLVDPGPHEVVYYVDGERKSRMMPMERGGEREITLDIPPGKGKRRSRPVVAGSGGGSGNSSGGAGEQIDTPSPPGRTRRIIGISLGAAGLLGVGVASYLTLDARSTYNDALDTHCMGMTNACTDEGVRITSDARSRANTATIITVVSLAAIGGGVALYLTAPKADESAEQSAIYVTPIVTDRGGGIVFGGGF